MNSKRKTLKTFVWISSKNSASGHEARLFYVDLCRCSLQYTVVSFFSLNVFSFSLAFFFSRFFLVSLFLLPLYPYLLIPLFPFRRKRWAGIGKKIDWSSYREITTCPSILSPSFYLSLYLPLFLIRFFKILDKEKNIKGGFVFVLLILRGGCASLRFACKWASKDGCAQRGKNLLVYAERKILVRLLFSMLLYLF